MWPIPNINVVIGYSCVLTRVVSHEYSLPSTGFNTCPPYFKVESKITRDFAAQCSMFTCRCFVMFWFSVYLNNKWYSIESKVTVKGSLKLLFLLKMNDISRKVKIINKF